MIERKSWHDVRDFIINTLRDDEQIIKNYVEAGEALAFKCLDCHGVLRSENSELVIMCLQGSRLKKVALELLNFARLNDFKTVRFHTNRPALNRFLNSVLKSEDLEFYEMERIYRVVL